MDPWIMTGFLRGFLAGVIIVAAALIAYWLLTDA